MKNLYRYRTLNKYINTIYSEWNVENQVSHDNTKEKKETVIVLWSNAIINPITVMIEIIHANIAEKTVSGISLLPYEAFRTVFFKFNFRVVNHLLRINFKILQK